MAVTSPSATASVRGTSFDFDTRNLGVSQGLVSFRGAVSGYPVMVGAGSSSGIGWYGKAQAPQPGATGTGADAGFSPTPPVGTDTLSGNTGGTGETPPPAEPDPPAPPSAPDPGTSGGGGGGSSPAPSTPGGGIGIGITY